MDSPFDRPCPGCGQPDPGLEDCALLGGAGEPAGGRCEILRQIEWTARRYLRHRYPERAGDAEDVVQEVWLHLAKAEVRRGAPRSGATFRSWLRTVVVNLVRDLFRRERIVAKKRCGACVEFKTSPPRGCDRTAVRDPGSGAILKNPWFGPKVDAETVPDSLEPPCREFTWRYRPVSLDEAASAAAARSSDPAEALEPSGTEVLRALAILARRGPEALRRAAVVYRHHVEGEPVDRVARSLGITARTARRDARRAFGELREILEEI